MIGILVFGGTNDVIGVKHCKDSFAIAFSPERNRHAWAVVGVAPLTRSCLSSDKVGHDCEDDPLNRVFKRIEESNHNACALLTAKGLNAEKMKVRLRDIKKSEAKPVTAPCTKAHQEVLLKARTHGLRFLETGGGTLCHDDGLIAACLHLCRLKREKMLKEKATRKAAEDIEQQALKILESMENATDAANQKKKGLSMKELCVLLEFYGVERKDIWKMRASELKE